MERSAMPASCRRVSSKDDDIPGLGVRKNAAVSDERVGVEKSADRCQQERLVEALGP
jgi:hypothetical protein